MRRDSAKGREFGPVSSEVLCGEWALGGNEVIPLKPASENRYAIRRLSDGVTLARAARREPLERTARLILSPCEIIEQIEPKYKKTQFDWPWWKKRGH